GKRWRYQSERV
ncbi:thiolase, C-terminal domain protein, partial [Vibrio parahaemolyticus V-223/04]